MGGPSTKTGALLAAAGLSSRMGEFKPMLPLGRDTIIRRGVKTLLAAGCDPVVAAVGHRAAELEAHLSDLPVSCVYNPDYAACDMFASVCLGLRALEGRCEQLLFTPADVCLYGEETARALINSGQRLCRPCFEGRRGHPVLLSAALIPQILAYEGAGGLAGALDSLGCAAELEVDVPEILLDADTPEQYRLLLERDAGGKA